MTFYTDRPTDSAAIFGEKHTFFLLKYSSKKPVQVEITYCMQILNLYNIPSDSSSQDYENSLAQTQVESNFVSGLIKAI